MDAEMSATIDIGVVVIGRNEGERLKRCLRSLPENCPVVYVDSGSTDGSVEFARSIGVDVLELDMAIPFTAARARNAGWKYLNEARSNLDFIQFIDGDCEIFPDWFVQAVSALRSEQKMAAVFGRLRERFPDSSIYNRMCDAEWNVPVGVVDHCGGNAMFRCSTLALTGGFNEELIAGEEPDLCLRMQQNGYFVQKISADMGLHDAAIFTFGSWWKRTKRGGYAYAEHVCRHRLLSFPNWRRQLGSMIFWTTGLPTFLVAVLLLVFQQPLYALSSACMIWVVLYGLQISRIAFRNSQNGASKSHAILSAAFLMIGKIPQMIGAITFLANRIRRKRQMLIEHRANAHPSMRP